MATARWAREPEANEQPNTPACMATSDVDRRTDDEEHQEGVRENWVSPEATNTSASEHTASTTASTAMANTAPIPEPATESST